MKVTPEFEAALRAFFASKGINPDATDFAVEISVVIAESDHDKLADEQDIDTWEIDAPGHELVTLNIDI